MPQPRTFTRFMKGADVLRVHQFAADVALGNERKFVLQRLDEVLILRIGFQSIMAV